MGKQEDAFIELLNKKSMILGKVLDITTTYAKAEADAEAYIYLMERRDNLFEHLQSIDTQLKHLQQDPAFSGDSEFISNVQKRKGEIQQTANQILNLDRKLSAAATTLLAGLKSNIKMGTKRKTVTDIYANDNSLGVGYYDKRN